MVARHLKREHSFTCYTDRSIEGVHCEPLLSDLPTWWSKIALLRDPVDETLYLDLDIVIGAEIVLPELGEKLYTLDDFSYSLLAPKKVEDPHIRKMLGGTGTVNSSVMYWKGDVGRKVWDDFKPSVMDNLHGDQNWITRCLWPDKIELFPPGFACSYKYHIQRGVKASPLIVFHGNPKAADLSRNDPIRKIWDSAA